MMRKQVLNHVARLVKTRVINVFVERLCLNVLSCPLPPVPTFISVPNAYMHLHHCKFVGCTYVVIVRIKLN